MESLSPAERYALSRQRQRSERSEFARFSATLGFALDPFQIAGCEALEEGRGVLVAAPTGAGKTVVGEFAVHLALSQGRKAFYTTPIKALSNQKYRDLVERYGDEKVGLLTGDTTLNGEAPIVVMTTEVLRNMLYAGSRSLDSLGYVVMDEVHYLADRFRGPVWEEVILHLDPSVQLVSLSATVSNVEEFGAWLTEVRGDMAVVVSEHRPVPLSQHVMLSSSGDGGWRAGPRLVDLYALEGSTATAPATAGAQVRLNPELVAATRQRPAGTEGPGRSRRGGGRNRHLPTPPQDRRRTPPRYAVIDALHDEGLLPAIVFVFSRAGCESAVQQCLAAGLRLTTPEQEAQIRALIDDRCAAIPGEDLPALGFTAWTEALSRGMAAHHAGLLPLFKEIVEELFSRGLVTVVFATETLALGINMPARSVVLEKLVKWDGSTHAAITPGEYTQLTGRAGRRGIDVEGHAVVVDHTGLDPAALAGLASTRLYPLTSRFRPTYNMAANLVESVGATRAREVLEMSFAQFQSDRGVVGLARQAADQATALSGYEQAMSCDRGDFTAYLTLRESISHREKELSRRANVTERTQVVQQLESLRRGDVVEIPSGRRAGVAVVLETGEMTFEGPRPLVLSDQRQVKRLVAGDVPRGLTVITRMRIPSGFNPRKPAARELLASTMRTAYRSAVASPDGDGGKSRSKAAGAVRLRRDPTEDKKLSALRAALRAHPCHGCPDREDHARWAQRWLRLRSENASLMRKIEGRTGTIAVRFDRVCHVLTTLGYLEREDGALTLTHSGRWLRRLYAEKDLLVAECLRRGVWDGLSPAQTAAVVSSVIFEARRESQATQHIPGGPQGQLALALDGTFRVWSSLEDLEQQHQLSTPERPDAGIVVAVHRWASGRSLDAVLRDSDLAAGDFVRWCKQILDVLDQISAVAPSAPLRRTASQAITALRRGVVAYSSVEARAS